MDSTCNYPPNEILNPIMGRPNYEYIILWILSNNEVCSWSDLKEKVNKSTLSIYTNRLKNKGYLLYEFNEYRITPKGRERYYELSQDKKRGRKLSYPPKIILEQRNYDHWILWMVYNNHHCVWSDFLDDPLSINQSSLSKNLNKLMELGYIQKDNKEYRITREGKSEYSSMLGYYDLDRQSILEEESKRIAELTQKTLVFFEKFNIKEMDIQYRFLNCVLKLNYEKIKTVLRNEDDFLKILLFLSINHPNEYPEYISTYKFSERYGIKKTTLEYYIGEIVENQIYPIKFFKLEVPPDKNYYFQSDEKIEMMLRVITKEHITKFTYLNKLFENSSSYIHRLDMESTVTAIVEEICQTIFSEDLEDSLRIFLPNYINYLAYKIEKKRRLIGIKDKLEGIIWQNIPNMFQSKNIDSLKDQYEDQINEIDKLIKQNPEKIDNYYSKIRILMYFDQYEDVLKLLDKMVNNFPDEESDLQIKKAYILKEQRNLDAGLEIIDDLIKKYPEDNNLLLHRSYWLQYLDRGEEALEIISNLLQQEPENSLYFDTFGELLMNYEDYGNAIQNFQQAIKIGRNSWYIYQTYIKLGICYKELENFGLAVEYLQKGKELTKQASSDQDSKQEWRAIADLFLMEIEQIETEF
ncbi:MAG: hypothetical protein ACFFFB_04645 [Candidatus Heimdallarchaeota archaeon]